jgi:molecular chaperone DnaK (HSP70)
METHVPGQRHQLSCERVIPVLCPQIHRFLRLRWISCWKSTKLSGSFNSRNLWRNSQVNMISSACGVDFGTSNSTVGWSRPGQSALLTLEGDKPTLPSVLFFNSEENSVAYGRAALTEYLAGYEGRLLRSLKSLLGSRLMDDETEVLGQAMSFRAVLGLYLGELKKRAEDQAQRSFSSAVFGRPVYFVDDNPQADRLAENTLAEVARSVGSSSSRSPRPSTTSRA